MRLYQRLLRFLLAVTACVVVASDCAGCGSQTKPSSSQTKRSSNVTTKLKVGVDLVTGFYDPAAIQRFSALVGTHVQISQNFISWQYASSSDAEANQFPTGRIEQAIQEGVEPEITWDPTVAGDPVNQPQMNLASIASGRYDSYIRQFAKGIAAVHVPILIRFAHEMNGNWTSYATANSGNRPGDFVRAWRHVYDVVKASGATNAQWVWSPNAVAPGDTSLRELYPGDAYVNFVAVDGYSDPKGGCDGPQQIFGPAFEEIQSFSNRPEMLGEVGVSADCPDKSALIAELFTWLRAHPRIKAFVWWERSQGGQDWEVDSSASSLKAFRSGVDR